MRLAKYVMVRSRLPMFTRPVAVGCSIRRTKPAPPVTRVRIVWRFYYARGPGGSGKSVSEAAFFVARWRPAPVRALAVVLDVVSRAKAGIAA